VSFIYRTLGHSFRYGLTEIIKGKLIILFKGDPMKIILVLAVLFNMVAFASENEVDPRSRECQARGYDCYLSKRCVVDGNLRPFARFHPKFKKIMKEVQSNPVASLKYPKIFYICAMSVE
jgi:hypothetical protein